MVSVNLWHEIEREKNFPDVVKVVVETPMGSKNRFVYDKKYNLVRLETSSSIHYPGDYGFIPQTYCEDGDALDALVLVTEATFPGIIIKARPVALLRMLDESVYDDKIICVPINDPKYKNIKDKKDIPSRVLEEIGHFFNVYKHLEFKSLKTEGWKGAVMAKKVIEHSASLYDRKFS